MHARAVPSLSLDMTLCCLGSPTSPFRVSRGFTSVGRARRLHEELQAMDLLHHQGMHVSRNSMYSLLTTCIERRDLAFHRHAHALLVSTGLDELATLGDHMIRLFASCGSLLEATLVFCKVLQPSVHTWHAIMSAHTMLGESRRVLDLYQIMQHDNLQPNKFIYSCISKACGNTGALKQGKLVHEQIMRSRVEVDVVMGSILIDMYAKCGDLTAAREVFDGMPNRNIVACNTMISGLVEHGHGVSALELFEKMLQQGLESSIVTFLCILKACGNIGSTSKGKVIHDLCIRSGLELDVSVGSALVDMYAKCKSFEEAHRVFEVLPIRNIVSWNALISGYAQQGCGELALEHFRRMQKDGIKPDEVTFSSISCACGNIGAIREGELVYDQLIRSGLQVDVIIGNTLVDMYGKCGRLKDAHNLFDRVQSTNVITWNTLIAAYVQHGLGHLAVKLFEGMQEEGIKPDKGTFSCILKGCSSLEAIGQGRAVHEHIIKHGCFQDLVVGNALVDMYAKCGSLEDASKVFNELVIRNVVSWNTIITGYLQHEQSLCGLDLLHKMLQEGVEPDRVTFLCLLKACGNVDDVDQGMMLHDWIINHGLQSEVSVGNMLVDMYIKCGKLQEARRVFDSMEIRDAVSWGAMITGYGQHEHSSCALKLFYEMQQEGLEPNTILLPSVLKACGNMQDIHHGRLIHKEIVTRKLELDTIIGNTLVDMYAKCGSLEDANTMFKGLSTRDLVMWNAMIAGYAQQGHCVRALEVFKELLQEGPNPNEVTFSCILNACACTGTIGQGRLIHDQVCQSEYNMDIIIGNTLVDMYCKCGALEDAISVLDRLKYQDVVAWNAMIAGHVDQGHGALAVGLFEKMQQNDISPDKVTFACILKACSSIGSLGQGKLIHEKIVESRLDVDSTVGNSLIDMYIKCGSLEEAVTVFAKLQDRDAVSYNTMISGYVQHDHGFPALQLFDEMQQEGIKPDKVTFLCTLKASGNIGTVKHGKMLHDQVIRDGLDSDLVIGNTLVNVYAMCGRLEEARRMFDVLPDRDVVSWSAMIAGYSQYGNCKLAGHCLEEMQRQGLKPVDAVFTSILSACSHAGKVEEGYKYFESMKHQYGIQPSIEHYNCMVQLLGCVGHLKEAESMLQTMPIAANICSWMTLLIACRSFGNIDMGKWCFNQAIHLDPHVTAGYVLVSNIYADVHMWQDFFLSRENRKSTGAWRKPGKAWIEVNDTVHEFIVGDQSHAKFDSVIDKLKKVRSAIKGEGYMPQSDLFLGPLSKEASKNIWCG